MIQGKTVNIEIEKTLHGRKIVPTLTYVKETWAWNGSQDLESRQWVYHLRGACGLNRMGSESHESVFGRFGIAL